jgi:hypothetical protein
MRVEAKRSQSVKSTLVRTLELIVTLNRRPVDKLSLTIQRTLYALSLRYQYTGTYQPVAVDRLHVRTQILISLVQTQPIDLLNHCIAIGYDIQKVSIASKLEQ